MSIQYTKQEILDAIEFIDNREKAIDLLCQAQNLCYQADKLLGLSNSLHKPQQECHSGMSKLQNLLFDNNPKYRQMLRQCQQFLTNKE